MQDVAAKVLYGNMQALTALSAYDNGDLSESVRINRAYVHTALKPLLPALLLGKKVAKLLHVVAQHTMLIERICPSPASRGQNPTNT